MPAIKYDHTYVAGKPFGVITCVRCNCRVRYGLEGGTRPKYCHEHETEEFNKLIQSEYWMKIEPTLRRDRIMQDLRVKL